MASIVNVTNELRSSSTRITREGRKITYQLHVIQPPERARACGSGAKSSADRRPVDPPPIVELRIFEGDAMNEITFSYNASFFLYATLENARHMAQGRVPHTQTNIPVLTGTPVAGMAYLDRPTPAGYFIFPDLSVRHEGKYRLSFSLFEELKDVKDADPDQQPGGSNPLGPAPPDSYVSYRCEVRSTPFTVYSAKKFPGLTESTALSRIVAEQGCRVRIRRDVRMRRRDNKHTKDWDEYEEEYERARRASGTPADAANQVMTPHRSIDGSDRSRRLSNCSIHSLQPRTSDPSMSAAYQAQSYGQQSLAPQTSPGVYGPQMPYSQGPPHSQYPAYTPQTTAQMPPPGQMAYQPPPPAYPPQPMHIPQQYSGYVPPPQTFAQPEFPHPSSHVRHDSMEYVQNGQEHRRNTMCGPQPQPQPQINGRYNQQSISSINGYDPLNRASDFRNGSVVNGTTPAPPYPANSLPPLKTNIIAADKGESSSPGSVPPMSAPANMHAHHQSQPPPRPPQQQAYAATYGDVPVPQTYVVAPPPPSVPGKRAYSHVFPTAHLDQRLSQGARPDAVVNGMPPVEGLYDEISDPDSGEELLYKRADGTQSHRRMPMAH